jgi:hypothetical protein
MRNRTRPQDAKQLPIFRITSHRTWGHSSSDLFVNMGSMVRSEARVMAGASPIRAQVSAKQSSTRRFHALYDRIHRSGVLWGARRRVGSNDGAAGVDAETIQAVEHQEPAVFLGEI